MPSIIYPITAGYRAQWQLWDALREVIYQEFLDLFQDWTIQQAGGKTIVEGRGAHIDLHHLLLGASDKTAEQRGRFGEGTKLGWLVLLREGVPFTLTSGQFHGLHARWASLYGQQVMEVCWDEGAFFDGSLYELDYAGPIWQERVIRSGDPRILFTDDAGRMVLEEEDPQLYVKGLWIGPAEPYSKSCAFGYNLPGLPLAEDRQLSDAYEASREMGRVWANVTDEALLVRFWQAVASCQGEKDTSMEFRHVADVQAHKRAMQQVFGMRAVIATDAAMHGSAARPSVQRVSQGPAERGAAPGAGFAEAAGAAGWRAARGVGLHVAAQHPGAGAVWPGHCRGRVGAGRRHQGCGCLAARDGARGRRRHCRRGGTDEREDHRQLRRALDRGTLGLSLSKPLG